MKLMSGPPVIRLLSDGHIWVNENVSMAALIAQCLLVLLGAGGKGTLLWITQASRDQKSKRLPRSLEQLGRDPVNSAPRQTCM